MDEHVGELIAAIAAPSMNKEAKKRSVLNRGNSGSSFLVMRASIPKYTKI